MLCLGFWVIIYEPNYWAINDNNKNLAEKVFDSERNPNERDATES